MQSLPLIKNSDFSLVFNSILFFYYPKRRKLKNHRRWQNTRHSVTHWAKEIEGGCQISYLEPLRFREWTCKPWLATRQFGPKQFNVSKIQTIYYFYIMLNRHNTIIRFTHIFACVQIGNKKVEKWVNLLFCESHHNDHYLYKQSKRKCTPHFGESM